MSSKGIPEAESYEIVRESVCYYWKVKYSYLGDGGCERLDVVNEIYLKLYQRDYFKNWNPDRARKRTYISRAVKNAMIDMHRTFKKSEDVSYESHEVDGKPLENYIPSKLTKNDIEALNIYDIVDNLPDGHYFNRAKAIWGDTPLGKKELNARNVAILLLLGYSVSEIASYFESPWKEGSTITEPTIYKVRNLIKKEFIKSGYCSN